MNTLENGKSNKLFMWIIFLIYPLGALILGIKNFQYKEYRIFILLFFVLFGYTFIVIPDSDGERNVQEFISTKDYNIQKYIDDIKSVNKGTSDNKDYYVITVKFITFFLSSNYKIFLLILSFFYFSVVLKFIGFVWDIVIFRNKDSLIYLIGLCFVINLSAGVSGVRFPMAFWVFSYGAINLIVKNNYKYLFIAALSVLIHFSLGFSFVFLILFYLSRYTSNLSLLLILLTLTFVVTLAFPALVSANLNIFGGGLEEKINSYTNEDYIENREDHLDEVNWYVKFNFFSYYYFTVIAILLTKIKKFKINSDLIGDRLFAFSIFLIIEATLTSSFLDSISNRYIMFVNLFGLVYLYYITCLNVGNKFLKFLRVVFIPILVINILVKLRSDFYTISPVLVFGNAILVFIYDATISVQDYLLG